MHTLAAKHLIKHLNKVGVLKTRASTFVVAKHPKIFDDIDIHDAFCTVAESLGHSRKELKRYSHVQYIVWAPPKIFNDLVREIFEGERLAGVVERHGGRVSPLPGLFIGREKVMVRQIPLVTRPPWPFKFLMELGGMLVVEWGDRQSLFEELRQYLNNHPQYDVQVGARERPDGTLAIYTYWFRELKLEYQKEYVNVPE